VLLHQDNAYESLSRLWRGGRFPHALLIEGAPGAGKRTLARHAAAMLLCRSAGDVRPCGRCLSCHKLETGNHPDFTVIDGTVKKAFAIDALRALRRDAWVAPNESECRVFLLNDLQNMDPRAQNALLKLIEEPPAHVRFLFTATSRAALLDTVRSRVTTVAMDELDAPVREEILQKLAPNGDAHALHEASLAFDTVGQALSALSDEKEKKRLSDAAMLLQRTADHEQYELLRLLSGWENDRDGLWELLSLARTLMIAGLTSATGRFSALQCAQITDIIGRTQERIRQNVGLAVLSAALSYELVQVASPRTGERTRSV
jgi:DNA polymerase-3 subunit delta'